MQSYESGGVGNLEPHEALIQAAAEYATNTVLIADKEGVLAGKLDALKETGLLQGVDCSMVWEENGHASSFEEMNFDVDEVLDDLKAVVREKRPKKPETKLAPAELVERFEAEATKRAAEGKPRPALATFAAELIGKEQRFTPSKKDLGAFLAKRLTNLIEQEEKGELPQGTATKRPLLAWIQTWIKTLTQ